jgi:hypothetical protein
MSGIVFAIDSIIYNLDQISTKFYICEWCENKKKGSEMMTCGKCNRTFCEDCIYGDDVTP